MDIDGTIIIMPFAGFFVVIFLFLFWQSVVSRVISAKKISKIEEYLGLVNGERYNLILYDKYDKSGISYFTNLSYLCTKVRFGYRYGFGDLTFSKNVMALTSSHEKYDYILIFNECQLNHGHICEITRTSDDKTVILKHVDKDS